MKLATDTSALARVAAAQRGVFAKADLQALLAERHPAAFARRVAALEAAGALSRFCRGWYVREPFDLATLSQRLAPESYVSFGTALARTLHIGSRPTRQLLAVKTGHARTYRRLGYEIQHLRVADHLLFGYAIEGGVRFAEPEKAVLDSLYFHLRGRRYPYDVFSDIDYASLERARLDRYLRRYRNPKFVTFVQRLLDR